MITLGCQHRQGEKIHRLWNRSRGERRGHTHARANTGINSRDSCQFLLGRRQLAGKQPSEQSRLRRRWLDLKRMLQGCVHAVDMLQTCRWHARRKTRHDREQSLAPVQYGVAVLYSLLQPFGELSNRPHSPIFYNMAAQTPFRWQSACRSRSKKTEESIKTTQTVVDYSSNLDWSSLTHSLSLLSQDFAQRTRPDGRHTLSHRTVVSPPWVCLCSLAHRWTRWERRRAFFHVNAAQPLGYVTQTARLWRFVHIQPAKFSSKWYH